MNYEAIEEKLKSAIREGASIVDNGIGWYDAAGKTGVDTQIGLELEENVVLLDLTDCIGPEEDLDDLKEDLSEISLTISQSKGGDPDACASSGRRRCGSCDRCSTVDATFTVGLNRFERKDDRILATFELRPR